MTGPADNQKVIDLLADPLPVTVPEVVSRLDALQDIADDWPRKQWDGLACFNYLYGIITKEVLERLDGGATFQDPEFLARLDVEFAKRYFVAIRADAAGAPTPRSWKVLLDSRSDDIDPMRFAVAGVNAHVNLDLAFALVNTLEGLSREFGATERHDYDIINDVFAEHMSSLRQHFEDRLEQVLDKVLFDDLLDDAGDLTVVLARDAAWRRAVQLWGLRGTPAFQRESDAIDWRASMIGRGILTFGVL
ncbi:DUF5995 family protein [Pseudonocardia acaciae]|uniref:DUF5995 family protein n=1 Tax=Pseudonocardia acaciae TaxID=551276 RepID=UPI00048EBD89|nr:DUF5995 family protein [Pseudonocardia acaciae]